MQEPITGNCWTRGWNPITCKNPITGQWLDSNKNSPATWYNIVLTTMENWDIHQFA